MQIWVEHFKDVLNQDPPVREADIPSSEKLLAVDCKRPPTGEIKKAIKMLKNNKDPGPDNIPAEALKADIETSTQMLYELFGTILEEEEVPLEWKNGHMLMSHYGIPEKFITIIRNTYTGMQSKVIHEGQLTEAFDITTGVRQGCILSHMQSHLAVDWIMKQATNGRRNGIQWTMFTQLDDLDFADDHRYQD
ncbi:uncharacterized protein [Mytilus edulis]|uniref:uncharacterized protein n=1 Tax=Mytilus edulis TaxID=6550 RepID=UPI0039F0C323